MAYIITASVYLDISHSVVMISSCSALFDLHNETTYGKMFFSLVLRRLLLIVGKVKPLLNTFDAVAHNILKIGNPCFVCCASPKKKMLTNDTIHVAYH